MAISLSTEDKLEYQFYPVSSGQIQFRVKAANDAHVALTTGPHESEPMYEVFIGGWGNSKSVIRKNRTKPEAAEVDTPGILSADEFRGFWIRWNAGELTVGKEGEPHPFLHYDDPESFGIGYFGVCTGWGASGEWLIEGRAPLKTPNELTYKFHSVRSGSVVIDVKAQSNAHIALTDKKAETSPMYEIMLGGWGNTASVIRYDRKQPDKVRVNTPNLLSANEHKTFVISWLDGRITVRSADKNGPVLMEWQDPNPIGVSHVGVRTGWGATGNWKLRFEHHPALPGSIPNQKRSCTERQDANSRQMTGKRRWDWCTTPKHVPKDNPPPPGFIYGQNYPNAGPTPSAPMAAVDSGSVCWTDASGGMVPPGSVEGGMDDEPLFVGRARHEGALIPGKVKPSHSVCYVAWGGGEHGKTDYQVLCGCRPTWVPVSGGNIPPNAIPAGETEDGETLFVGRVRHEGTLTIGKVQPSHAVCYIPYSGAEVAFPDYEIMVQQ